ncbi:MAG: DUF882 domain-containing protein [Pseudomonadales bacterium]
MPLQRNPDTALCSRFLILALLLFGAIAPVSNLHANNAAQHSKSIGFHNLHTGESLRITYWRNGQFVKSSLQQLNSLLRDHRRNEVADIDPRLFELLNTLRESVGSTADFEVISGYRSPQTNQSLAEAGRQVARKSQHILGKAIDIRLPGTSLETLHKAAVALKLGGVGLYPENDFIHVDLGRVRYW